MRADGPGSRDWTARRVRASGSSILLAIVAVVAVFLAQGFFVAASQPVGWATAAAGLALVLSPVIRALSRRVPRGIAIVATVLVGLLAIGTVGLGLFFEVREQLQELRQQLPAAAADLEAGGGEDGILAQLELTALVQDLVDQTSARIEPQPTVEGVAGTVPAYFVTGILMVFFLVWGGSLTDGLLRQVGDDRRRERLARSAEQTARLTQRYILAAVASGVVVGAIGGAVAWAVGLPTPLVLGVVLGAASVIPYIGVLFGGLPILLLAGALEPVTTTLVLGVLLIGLQAASTVVTRRVIERWSLRVGPAVIVVTALVGSDVYGIGGALVGILAGVLLVGAIEAWRRDQRSTAPSSDATPVEPSADTAR
jgi:predicted PurR-regulated permease PerM